MSPRVPAGDAEEPAGPGPQFAERQRSGVEVLGSLGALTRPVPPAPRPPAPRPQTPPGVPAPRGPENHRPGEHRHDPRGPESHRSATYRQDPRADDPRVPDVRAPGSRPHDGLDALPSAARVQATLAPSRPLPDTGPDPEPSSLPDVLPRRAPAPRPRAGRADQAGQQGQRTGLDRFASGPWPLLSVLLVQAVLSLRLIWSNTAFQDEALYLRAGHLEWAHWLRAAPIPDFPSYFSGAPVLYPPVGAVADSLGGLPAARLLSLLFMLGVTSLLWAATGRLYSRRAAILAAGLFATLTGTQFLGAFATYDPMALLLLALAGWLAVRAADCRSLARGSIPLAAAGLVLALADAVKYATTLFSPIVIILAVLAVWRRHGLRAALGAGLIAAGGWAAGLAGEITAGGRDYWLGIATSTLARAQSTAAVSAVLQRSYVWTGLILVLAVAGALFAGRVALPDRFLALALAGAALLAPAEQARIHTTVSLQKHVVFGAWFAAIGAGYLMSRLSRLDRGHGWPAVMALPIVASTLFGSYGQANGLYEVWPNSAGVVTALRPLAREHPGLYLAEDYDVEAYYLQSEVPWQDWSNTYYFRYPGQGPGPASYAAAIDRHYFALVILNFGDTRATDRLIVADIDRAGGYRVVDRSGRFTVWASAARG